MSLRDIRTATFTVHVPNSSIGNELVPIGCPRRLVLYSLTAYSLEANQPLIDIQIYHQSYDTNQKTYVCGGFVWSSTTVLINAGNVVLEKPLGLARWSLNYLNVYYVNRDSSGWKINLDLVFAK